MNTRAFSAVGRRCVLEVGRAGYRDDLSESVELNGDRNEAEIDDYATQYWRRRRQRGVR
jgi:hypothetical protein